NTASATNEQTSVRQSAFDALRDLGNPAAVAGLQQLATNGLIGEIRIGAIVALASLDLKKAVTFAASALMAEHNEKEAESLWRALLKVKDSGPVLAKALPKTGLPVEMARAGLRVAREGGRSEPDLVWALTRGADLETETQ